MKIKTKVKRINEKIQKLQETLRDIQEEECEHNQDVTVQYKGSSGYDYDDYWVDWCCLECGKRWTTDQNREAYLKEKELGDKCKRLNYQRNF